MKRIIFAAALLGFAGCYRTTVVAPVRAAAVEDDYTAHHFILGASGSRIETQCEIARVKFSHSFVDLLLEVLTVGIYTPTSVEVWCVDDLGRDTRQH